MFSLIKKYEELIKAGTQWAIVHVMPKAGKDYYRRQKVKVGSDTMPMKEHELADTKTPEGRKKIVTNALISSIPKEKQDAIEDYASVLVSPKRKSLVASGKKIGSMAPGVAKEKAKAKWKSEISEAKKELRETEKRIENHDTDKPDGGDDLLAGEISVAKEKAKTAQKQKAVIQRIKTAEADGDKKAVNELKGRFAKIEMSGHSAVDYDLKRSSQLYFRLNYQYISKDEMKKLQESKPGSKEETDFVLANLPSIHRMADRMHSRLTAGKLMERHDKEDIVNYMTLRLIERMRSYDPSKSQPNIDKRELAYHPGWRQIEGVSGKKSDMYRPNPYFNKPVDGMRIGKEMSAWYFDGMSRPRVADRESGMGTIKDVHMVSKVKAEDKKTEKEKIRSLQVGDTSLQTTFGVGKEGVEKELQDMIADTRQTPDAHVAEKMDSDTMMQRLKGLKGIFDTMTIKKGEGVSQLEKKLVQRVNVSKDLQKRGQVSPILEHEIKELKGNIAHMKANPERLSEQQSFAMKAMIDEIISDKVNNYADTTPISQSELISRVNKRLTGAGYNSITPSAFTNEKTGIKAKMAPWIQRNLFGNQVGIIRTKELITKSFMRSKYRELGMSTLLKSETYADERFRAINGGYTFSDEHALSILRTIFNFFYDDNITNLEAKSYVIETGLGDILEQL